MKTNKSFILAKKSLEGTFPTIVLILGFLVLWFYPCPEGLSLKSWHLFAIFFSSIVAIILKVLPMTTLAFTAITLATITQTLTIHQVLGKFSSNIVWLIVIAFLLAKGFIKSGLGSRIAYYFVYFFGQSTLGLGYGLVLTEFFLAPFIPSNTARGAGVIYPIVIAISEEYQSKAKDGTNRKIGAYLIQVCFHANIITSAMFLTAMAANPLVVAMAANINVTITWLSWFEAAIVPGIASLVLMPLLLYFLYPPQIKTTPKARAFAKKKLSEMGRISKNELIMISVFMLLLTLWVLGGALGFDATSTAFLGLTILLLTKVLSVDDILGEKNAWNTFIWLTTLLMLTGELNEMGFVGWLVGKMGLLISGLSWQAALVITGLCYFFLHYFFASKTARVSALYGAFSLTAVAAGAPAPLVAYLFAFTSSLSACLTHYSTGSGPVFFGADYTPFGTWWRLGFIVALAHIGVWGGLGVAWWKYLGYW